MNKIVDKIALIVCCSINMNQATNTIYAVVALLSVITLSSLSQCYEKSKISLISEITYTVLCFINPVFCFMFPVILYDIIADRNFLIGILFIPILIYSISSLAFWQVLLIASCILISIIISNRTARLEIIEQKLIETRDNSAEINMLLIEKNKHLCERQDYEIYLATLKERNRIAREIHDNVGHMLSRLILQVGALLVINKDQNQKESLESIKDTLNSAMTSIRESVHNLHDEAIELKQAIIEIIKPIQDNYKINLDLDFSNNVSKTVKLCFIGIIKESISNIIKHSTADTINITIREHPAFYQLTIEDNGRNINTINSVNNGGMGLSNMRERVNGLGGIIQFNCSEKGFKIFVSVTKK